MIDFLYAVDVAVFHFINNTISNPVGDLLWPLITDYDKLWPVRVVLLVTWLVLLVKGGRTGRTAGLIIIPVLFLSDKLSSEVIKGIVERARPCHEVGGTPVVQGIHLLVSCGPGKSFPSSHAVNNFAVATVFAFFYSRWRLWFLLWASAVAISRPAVGVHYPSDILCGAIIGSLVALFVIWLWLLVERNLFPATVEGKPSRGLH